MSDKLKKLLAVVSLTLLIWAWAFMSKAKEESFPGTLEVSSSIDPGLLVTFSQPGGYPQTKIALQSLNFKGAPSRIYDLSKRNNLSLDDPNREKLDFYYDPAEHGKDAGSYPLSILDLLQEEDKIHELGLTLEACSPSDVTVTIERLVKKELPVQCVNKLGRELGANCDPAMVEVFVREGYVYESATVVLSSQDIETARKESVTKTPYVELGVAGVKRRAAVPVQVTLKGENQLNPKPFQTTRPIGIIMSQELQQKYKVTIVDDAKAREATTIFATDQAFKAFQESVYPLQIEITDSDVADLSQILKKTVTYNFPPEYVRSGEIERDKTKLPVKVDVKIELLTPEAE